MSDLPKTFDPAEIEARWYAHWESEGLFRPARDEAEPFTIVIPPPNVTGSLHIGHALDNTLQDILIRHARMQGKDALWVVGMDHAGIATQMVVERQLEAKQDKRTNYSREAFIQKVWEWKAESGGQITRQLRRLGASCDWANEQFTMDPHFVKAVLKVFVELYDRGLLYRDKRLVNWDPGLKTAISDLEVETHEINSSFWHFRYPLEDPGSGSGAGGSGAISVATTRPETMLADMAVAVHPDDERYRAWVGKKVRQPVTGRLIPIITDEHADPALGSGAVKITPGHDFNDFEVGKRAGIAPAEMLNMLDPDAKVVQTADGLVPAELLGLDRFEARKRVVAMIEAEGCLEGIEDRVVATPFGDRSQVVIEPWLTDQWYVDAASLAKKPIEAVRSGEIRIVPKSWEKTWFNWLENIQPWCVSRQLWWGHRIPAWYDETGQVYVAESEVEAQAQAGQGAALTRDPDVLDTWFSSALWPFATLGWPDDMIENPSPLMGSEPQLRPPDEAKGGSDGRVGVNVSIRSAGLEGSPHPNPPHQGEGARLIAKPGSTLARHYPNDVLISGFDIIFFWDARMAMQGFELMGERPWKTLYLHGLVRDAKGQKMSKSKGNTVDPLGLIDRYGADALRFTLAAMESQGRDIKLDEKRVEGYRNFATKLWNAARFCQANGIGASEQIEPPDASLPVNKWIIGETVKTVQALDIALAELRFDESANTIYHFTWATFCDWYLELIKPVLSKSSPSMGEDLGGGERSSSAGAGGESTPPPTPPHQGEGSEAAETRAVAGWVLDQILVMLHPFMPFVTEELWGAMGERAHYPLITAKWPMADARALDPEAGPEIDWLIRLVSELRSARTEVNVPPSARPKLRIYGADEGTRIRLLRYHSQISRLARVEGLFDEARFVDVETREPGDLPEPLTPLDVDALFGALQVDIDGVTYLMPLAGLMNVDAERARLAASIEAAEKERDALAARLSNPSFVERAKSEAVEKARADHAEKASDAEKYRAALARLG